MGTLIIIIHEENYDFTYHNYFQCATREQMCAAYPKGKEFFLLKKKYDSTEVFQNKFYLGYK